MAKEEEEKGGKRAKGKRQKEKQHHAGDADGGIMPRTRIREKTPFLCWMRFMLDLPEPPLPVLSFEIPVDRAKLARFSHLGAQDDSNRNLPLENGLGASLDPLDLDRYAIPPDGAPALPPEDARLLTETNTPGKADNDAVTRAFNGDASTSQPRMCRQLSSQTLQYQSQPQEDEEELEPHEEAEKSFADAMKTPKHPEPSKRDSVYSVSELPVLPDFENWPNLQPSRNFNDYAQIFFTDGDPFQGMESSGEEDKVTCERSFLGRNFMYESERFIGLMSPSSNARSTLRERGLPDEDEGPLDYEWLREYHFEASKEGEDRAYCAHFREENVTYVPLTTTIKCNRHSRRRGMKIGRSLIPSVGPVTLGKRKYSEHEEELMREAKQSLQAT
jgi:hypothetical protein